MKQKLSKIKSRAVPLPNQNIDTDQIIPARFLKAINREGFGENLFRDWRFDANGKPKKDFVLNNPLYKGKILVAGKNFGCGSSREHAAWALKCYGFDAVVSSFFADIFKNNALNNTLLPVQVSEDFLQKLLVAIVKSPNKIVSIDMPAQKISFQKHSVKFPLDPYKKMCLTEGLDDIDYLLSLSGQIKQFEKKRQNDFSLASKV